MRYPVTSDTELILSEIVRTIRETRPLLRMASEAAIDQWDDMRRRFPTEDDVRQGFVSLCELDLRRLRSELRGFRQAVCGQSGAEREGGGLRRAGEAGMTLSSKSPWILEDRSSA